MNRYSFICLAALVLFSAKGFAERSSSADEAKLLSGMSLVGNKDAPKSLYIVPWKSSEIGVKTDLNSSLLNEDLVPVDKPVFVRELDFYRVSTQK